MKNEIDLYKKAGLPYIKAATDIPTMPEFKNPDNVDKLLSMAEAYLREYRDSFRRYNHVMGVKAVAEKHLCDLYTEGIDGAEGVYEARRESSRSLRDVAARLGVSKSEAQRISHRNIKNIEKVEQKANSEGRKLSIREIDGRSVSTLDVEPQKVSPMGDRPRQMEFLISEAKTPDLSTVQLDGLFSELENRLKGPMKTIILARMRVLIDNS